MSEINIRTRGTLPIIKIDLLDTLFSIEKTKPNFEQVQMRIARTATSTKYNYEEGKIL